MKSDNSNRYIILKTDVHLWQYLAELFLEWKILQMYIVQNITTYILHSINLFRNVCRVSDKVEYMTEQDIPQIVTKYINFACWITKPSDTHCNNTQYVLFFKDTNGYANAPQYYVILTLHVWCSDVRTEQLINSL